MCEAVRGHGQLIARKAGGFHVTSDEWDRITLVLASGRGGKMNVHKFSALTLKLDSVKRLSAVVSTAIGHLECHGPSGPQDPSPGGAKHKILLRLGSGVTRWWALTPES
jgi:hypothetical protein